MAVGKSFNRRFFPREIIRQARSYWIDAASDCWNARRLNAPISWEDVDLGRAEKAIAAGHY